MGGEHKDDHEHMDGNEHPKREKKVHFRNTVVEISKELGESESSFLKDKEYKDIRDRKMTGVGTRHHHEEHQDDGRHSARSHGDHHHHRRRNSEPLLKM